MKIIHIKKLFSFVLLLFATSFIKASAPSWSINEAAFNNVMTITGIVTISGTELTSSNDLIAAFVGTECRGVTHLLPSKIFNHSFAYLMIMSNTQGETVHFKVYRSAGDSIIDITDTRVFTSDQMLGNQELPYIFSTEKVNATSVLSVSLGIAGETSNIDNSKNTITVTVPLGTDVTSIIPDVTSSLGSQSQIGGKTITETTVVNLSTAVVVTVIAQDGTKSNWTVSVVYNTVPLTFSIINGATPIVGATVLVKGYTDIVTDAKGEATFNVKPQTDVVFTIKASGQKDSSATVTIADQNITKVIDYSTLIKKYSVSFVIKDGLDPIAGATVSIPGFIDVVTGANGTATFIIPSQTVVDYTIKIAGKKDSTASLTVTNQNIIQVTNYSTITKSYSVSFIIKDGANLISGAKVTLDGYGELTTNSLGKVTFENVIDNIKSNYIIKTTGYSDSVGTILLKAKDTLITIQPHILTYKVIFVVKNSQGVIANAKVTLVGYGDKVTDALGMVTFLNVKPQNTVSFGINAQGYVDSVATFTLTLSDVVKTILLKKVVSVSFSLKDGLTPIVGAKVTLDGYGDLITNSLGKVTFANVNANLNIDYIVTAVGFKDSVGKILLKANDTLISIKPSRIGYTVAFVVKNSQGIIANAKVTLVGYGDKVTDALGMVSFTNVKPQNTVSFGISAQGYVDSVATFTLASSDVLKTILLKDIAKEDISVTFVVKDGLDPIAGATVSISGYKDVITGTNGTATFTIPSQTVIDYTIKIAGKKDSTATLTVTNQNIIQVTNYSTSMKSYSVSFIVKDGLNLIAGAKVTLDGYGELTTNSLGKVIFANVIGSQSINYIIKSTGYTDSIGILLLKAKDTLITIQPNGITYKVVFVVKNLQGVLANAKVSLVGYGEKVTDALGIATYTNVKPQNTLSFGIKAQGYIDSVATFTVTSSDVVKTVLLKDSVKAVSVSFIIKDGINPIAGAKVTLDGYGELISNSLGKVSFANVNENQKLSYIIKSTGYTDSIGTILLKSNDTSITVQPIIIGYNVVFVVKNSQGVIANAKVSINGYGEKVTDALGMVTYANVKPQNMVGFSVKAQGCVDSVATFTLTASDIINTILLKDIAKEPISVSFIIKDGLSPIAGVKVALDGYGELISNSLGKVTFSNVLGFKNLDYVIKAAGYTDSTGTILLKGNDTLITIQPSIIGYKVVFIVKNSKGVISNANVSLVGYGDKVTDALGMVTYTNIKPQEMLGFGIKVQGYIDSVATFTMTSTNTTKTIIMKEIPTANKIEEIENMVVYPNPCKNQLTIQLPPSSNRFKIIDSKGQLMFESTSQIKQELNTEILPVGIYYITSYSEDGKNITQSIIKE